MLTNGSYYQAFWAQYRRSQELREGKGNKQNSNTSFSHFRVLSLTAPMLGRKASAEPSEGKSQSPRVRVSGYRGMEGNQRTRWKWRGMSVSGYMPWSLDRAQDLGEKEKNSGLTGCVINPLSWRWAKEEGVGSKRLNSSKSTSLGNGAPLGKDSFLKCMVFYFLRYGPWTWPRRR